MVPTVSTTSLEWDFMSYKYLLKKSIGVLISYSALRLYYGLIELDDCSIVDELSPQNVKYILCEDYFFLKSFKSPSLIQRIPYVILY